MTSKKKASSKESAKASTAEAPMAKGDPSNIYRTDLGESIPTPKIPTATDNE